MVKTDSAMCVYDSLQSGADKGGFTHVCMLLDNVSVQPNSYMLSARLLFNTFNFMKVWLELGFV